MRSPRARSREGLVERHQRRSGSPVAVGTNRPSARPARATRSSSAAAEVPAPHREDPPRHAAEYSTRLVERSPRVRYVYDFDEDARRRPRAARRQGRRPRRDDARSACPSRPASRSRPRPAAPTWRAASRCPTGSTTRSTSTSRALEERAGKRFGDPADPLLVSVRSGAAVSMPGMMDTILNLGLNDVAVEGLGASDRQRALRLRLLPAVHPDVRRGRRRRRRRSASSSALADAEARRAASTHDTDLDGRRPRAS